MGFSSSSTSWKPVQLKPRPSPSFLICLKRHSCSESVGRLYRTLARVWLALAEVSTNLALAIYHYRSRNGGNMLWMQNVWTAPWCCQWYTGCHRPVMSGCDLKGYISEQTWIQRECLHTDLYVSVADKVCLLHWVSPELSLYLRHLGLRNFKHIFNAQKTPVCHDFKPTRDALQRRLLRLLNRRIPMTSNMAAATEQIQFIHQTWIYTQYSCFHSEQLLSCNFTLWHFALSKNIENIALQKMWQVKINIAMGSQREHIHGNK